jgi:hypothetical protein
MDEITEYRTQGAKAGLPGFGARFRSLFSLPVPCLGLHLPATHFAASVVLCARNRKRRQRESSHERY